MTDYHEPPEELDARTRDMHRALTSLKEEIEAVDWYAQRVKCASSPELKQVLQHNLEEEIEHACMTLEWLRRESKPWDETLRKFLFRPGSIVGAESDEKSGARAAAGSGGGLGAGVSREASS